MSPCCGKGKLAGAGKVADLDRKAMAAMMIGDQTIATLDTRAQNARENLPLLSVRNLTAPDRTGLKDDQHRGA